MKYLEGRFWTLIWFLNLLSRNNKLFSQSTEWTFNQKPKVYVIFIILYYNIINTEWETSRFSWKQKFLKKTEHHCFEVFSIIVSRNSWNGGSGKVQKHLKTNINPEYSNTLITKPRDEITRQAHTCSTSPGSERLENVCLLTMFL